QKLIEKTEFLLEIGTEEIPAGYIPPALEYLSRELSIRLEKNYLLFGRVRTAGTPRRLVVHVSDLDACQPDRELEILGPPKAVAYDDNGKPTKAAEGFAKKNNVALSDLTIKTTERGDYVCAIKVEKGRPAVEILAEIVPKLLTTIPFPKTMRWGSEKVRFARPVRWILALVGDQVVPFSFGNVSSDRYSQGHRFASNEPILFEDASYDLYLTRLKEAKVIVDVRARRQTLLDDAEIKAKEADGQVLKDEDLEELNTFLTEFPWATCGSFDNRFLSLPDPVLITCMKEHQKYFAVVDGQGRLKPNFIAINNTPSTKPELIRKGHERVLGARLADADFFFKEDTSKKLEEFVPELGGMVFHKGLGSLLDKVKRVEHLSEFIAHAIDFKDVAVVKRAAYLCKADLCTEMVGEFPTLQGVIGKEYALLSGEDRAVAVAIEEHYMPVRSGGPLPQTTPGAIVSIADKADTITATFAIGLKPSGTQDPYALRRQALGIINIILEREIDLRLPDVIDEALGLLIEFLPDIPAATRGEILEFFKQRFRNELISRGIDYDVVDAAANADFTSVFDCYQRAQALKAVRKQPEFNDISIAFKRVMNILKDFEGGGVKTELFETQEEQTLYDAFLQVKERIAPILSNQSGPPTASQYQEALLLLLTLKPHIDRFFDNVMVMVENEAIRHNRLSLLWLVSRLFLKIGDLSYIVTEG
ncbi:MAG: glycine--tRNA ligase subunit beta, partial [Thermodesulfobacteria bacterium]|nr:glycine--tRNA ligase subunit beta [Thermodesulfobacteriota bacterium]